jgi:hypothetical protein
MVGVELEGRLFGEGLLAFKTLGEGPHKAPIGRLIRKGCDLSATNNQCIVCALVKTKYNEPPRGPSYGFHCQFPCGLSDWSLEPLVDLIRHDDAGSEAFVPVSPRHLARYTNALTGFILSVSHSTQQ